MRLVFPDSWRRLLIAGSLLFGAGGTAYALTVGGWLFRPAPPPVARFGADEADIAPATTATAREGIKRVPRIARPVDSAVPRHSAQREETAGWPTPFGPHHDSVSPETGLDWSWCETAPRLLWEAPIGTGYNIPAIAQGRLVAWSRSEDLEELHCRDPFTGDLLWTRAFPATYRCPFEYSSGPHGSPVIDRGRIYILGAAGELRCVELETGETVWERALKTDLGLAETPYSLGASPLVVDGRVILPLPSAKSRQAGVVAFDTQSGETLWTATDHGLSFATAKSVSLEGRSAALVFTGQGLVTLDTADGTILGQFQFGVGEGRTERVNAVSPLVVGNTVFATAGPGPGIVALSLSASGRFDVLWRNRRLLDSQYTTILHHNGFLYGFNSLWNGTCELRCIEARSAAQRWAHESDLRRGQMILVDGRLVIVGEHGHLGVVDADPAEPRVRYLSGEPLLSKPCYCAPAFAGGLLFVRDERRLLAIDCRPPGKIAAP